MFGKEKFNQEELETLKGKEFFLKVNQINKENYMFLIYLESREKGSMTGYPIGDVSLVKTIDNKEIYDENKKSDYLFTLNKITYLRSIEGYILNGKTLEFDLTKNETSGLEKEVNISIENLAKHKEHGTIKADG